MASDGEDDDLDLEALRNAALASIKPKTQHIQQVSSISSISNVGSKKVPSWQEFPGNVDIVPEFSYQVDPVPQPVPFNVPTVGPPVQNNFVLTQPHSHGWRHQIPQQQIFHNNYNVMQRARFCGSFPERHNFPTRSHLRTFGDRGRPLRYRGRYSKRGFGDVGRGFNNNVRGVPNVVNQQASGSVNVRPPFIEGKSETPARNLIVIHQPGEKPACSGSRVPQAAVDNQSFVKATSGNGSLPQMIRPQDKYHASVIKKEEPKPTESEVLSKPRDKFSRYKDSDSEEDEEEDSDSHSEVDDITKEIDKVLEDDEDLFSSRTKTDQEPATKFTKTIEAEVSKLDLPDNEDEVCKKNTNHNGDEFESSPASPPVSEADSFDLDALAAEEPVLIEDLGICDNSENINILPDVKDNISVSKDTNHASDKVKDKDIPVNSIHVEHSIIKEAGKHSASSSSSSSEEEEDGDDVNKAIEESKSKLTDTNDLSVSPNSSQVAAVAKSSTESRQTSTATVSHSNQSKEIPHFASSPQTIVSQGSQGVLQGSISPKTPPHSLLSPQKHSSPPKRNLSLQIDDESIDHLLTKSRSPSVSPCKSPLSGHHSSSKPQPSLPPQGSRSPRNNNSTFRQKSPVFSQRSRSPKGYHSSSRQPSSLTRQRSRSPRHNHPQSNNSTSAPPRRSLSPHRSHSQQQRDRSPARRGSSPRRRSLSPFSKKSLPRSYRSPHDKSGSSYNHNRSPYRRSRSPNQRTTYRRSRSPYHRKRSPITQPLDEKRAQQSRRERERLLEKDREMSNRKGYSHGRNRRGHSGSPLSMQEKESASGRVDSKTDGCKKPVQQEPIMTQAELEKLPPAERAKLEARQKKFSNVEIDSSKKVSLKGIKERVKKQKKIRTEVKSDTATKKSNSVGNKVKKNKKGDKEIKAERDTEERVELPELEDDSEDSDTGRAWREEANMNKRNSRTLENKNRRNVTSLSLDRVPVKDAFQRHQNDRNHQRKDGRDSNRSRIGGIFSRHIPKVPEEFVSEDESEDNSKPSRLTSSVVATKPFKVDIPPEKLRIQIQVKPLEKVKRKSKEKFKNLEISVPTKRKLKNKDEEEVLMSLMKKTKKKKKKKDKKKKKMQKDNEDLTTDSSEDEAEILPEVQASRPSVLERLGRKVPLKDLKEKKKKKKKKNLSDDESMDDIDLKMLKMKEKNAAILRRQKEIEQDKKMYG